MTKIVNNYICCDDNFVSEINYFCDSLSNSKNFATWGNEILKQSIVVEKIMRL